MQLTVSLTNRAILLSGENIQGDAWQFDRQVDSLSSAARRQIAARLHEDQYICEGGVNGEGGVEPLLDCQGHPVLLRLDGTGPRDLSDALAQDEREVQEHLAQLTSKKAA